MNKSVNQKLSKHYPDVDANPDFAKLEEQIVDFWQKDGTFAKSVENHPAQLEGKNNEFIFYDGPPFANGLPHYGHLLTGYVKDLFARYQTMKGKRVERRFGWDCHGLPAEMGSEKELGISGRAAITNYGIGKFNEHCRTSVMKYTHEWEYYVTRQARWVDFKNDYKTMDKNFMESVLWAFKQLYDKGLVYEAYRVMPYSWAAETPLSNFETKLDNSYRERADKAITVAFELLTIPERTEGHFDHDISLRVRKDGYKVYLLAWTTTPWTLPSNLALAVNSKIMYSFAVDPETKTIVIASKEYIAALLKDGKFKDGDDLCCTGGDLVGRSYKPLFPYFADHKNSFKILDGSSFVTDGDGTGIVHMAPGFGEDDQKCCEANGIELVVPVDGQGKYTDEIFDITFTKDGKHGILSLKSVNVIQEVDKSWDEPYKPEQLEKYGLANLRIINYLKNYYPDGTNRVIKEEEIKHNYPHCWRTDKPLIYRAMPSWYVEVTKFRDRAVELNKQINWIPEHIRDGQMGHMLATAPDWSISRNRFWGTPIPVWRSKSGKIITIGSIKELEELSGKKVTDLHRPYIDEIKITKDGEEYTRVEDVFDCWFESGSMPFAQVHYPFENKEWFETHFPADFITEYVGQTRGWFNTLIMVTAGVFSDHPILKNKPPFQNCICHGVVLDAETGQKYSKRLKNYKDPKEVMDQFGADALRWLMVASPVMRGMDLSVDPEGKFIRDVVRLAIKPIWNAYNFFTLYANADGVKAELNLLGSSVNLMDSYIIKKCNTTVGRIERALDSYDTPSATEAVQQFFDVLNNWYIRRSKERFWKEEQDKDKQAAYDTLYTVLHIMCRAIAPLLPLTTEMIYKGLTGQKSVHLTEFPGAFATAVAVSAGKAIGADELEDLMDRVRDTCNAALSIRNKENVRVRQPLASLMLASASAAALKELPELLELIKDEVNIHDVKWAPSVEQYATYKLSLNNQVLGKRLPEKMKQIIPAAKKGEWKIVNGEVEICGEILLTGEYTLNLEPKPEYKNSAAPLSTNDALVILDLTITPELEAEGIARDVVRMVQQARKDSGFHVSDRISLIMNAPDSIAKAVNAHKDYIAQQTLSVSVGQGDAAASSYKVEAELEGQKFTLGLTKAA
jgi:isoleucyl-tRNA synthetase